MDYRILYFARMHGVTAIFGFVYLPVYVILFANEWSMIISIDHLISLQIACFLLSCATLKIDAKIFGNTHEKNRT